MTPLPRTHPANYSCSFPRMHIGIMGLGAIPSIRSQGNLMQSHFKPSTVGTPVFSAFTSDDVSAAKAITSFRFLFLSEESAPVADLRAGVRFEGAEHELIESPRSYFRKAMMEGDAQTFCVINIDDFGGLGPLFDRLRKLRETAPYVPVALLSFKFCKNDFTSTRLPVCDVSIRLPCNRGIVVRLLGEAIANNHLWCARHHMRTCDLVNPIGKCGQGLGASCSPVYRERDSHTRSIGENFRILYGFDQGTGAGRYNLMPVLFLGTPEDAENSAFAYWLRSIGFNLFCFASPEIAIGQALAAPKSWSLMVLGPSIDHSIFEQQFSRFAMADRPAILLLSEFDPGRAGHWFVWDAWLRPAADPENFSITFINALEHHRQTCGKGCSPECLYDLNTTLRLAV